MTEIPMNPPSLPSAPPDPADYDDSVDQAVVDGIVKLLRAAEGARMHAAECERKAQSLIDSTPCWDGAFVSSDRNDVLVTCEGRATLYRVKR